MFPPYNPVTVPPPSPPTAAAAPAISGTYACRGARGGAGVTPALTRCAQEERLGLLAWRMKTTDWGGFEVVSEGGVADYVESVGGDGSLVMRH